MVSIAVLENVTEILSERTILHNVNLQILDGEIFALLGPNGSGKTTLLKILASLFKPTSGRVFFREAEITPQNIEKMRMESTMVFQKTVLFGNTVYDNVAYGLRLRKLQRKEIDERVADVLKLVRLEGFEKRPARKLSGGEQQRVALARAIALNTPLLLLDEPTANLDPKNTAIIEQVMATVNRELKTTIVMATHNMLQARSLPHRVALISNGEIGEIGSPPEVFGTLSETIVNFTAGENIFSGVAKIRENGSTSIDIGDGILLEATTQRNGQISVFISPRDIILSPTPISSSARNVLKGKILEIVDLGSVVRLKVKATRVFTVQITKRSFNEMQLNLNSEVYMVFKASSVQVI